VRGHLKGMVVVCNDDHFFFNEFKQPNAFVVVMMML